VYFSKSVQHAFKTNSKNKKYLDLELRIWADHKTMN
jgi:hypothetical protein